jgi:hypothetical protein
LNGRIAYRCMKADNGSNEYYHLAASSDDEASRALQSRDFFKAYTDETKRVSGGTVEVLPLAIIAETSAKGVVGEESFAPRPRRSARRVHRHAATVSTASVTSALRASVEP